MLWPYPDGRVVFLSRNNDDRVSAITTTVNGQLTYLAVNRQYDAAGHLTSQTYGNGLVETRTYDLAGRLITQQLGSSTRSYGYDEAGNLASYNEDVFSRALGYDLLDRLTSSVPSTGPAEAISYDANGNRLSLKDQKGTDLFSVGDTRDLG